MKKNKEDALKTREHLIDAALEMFYRKGVARTTLDQIAKMAGVTRGAVYWHFKNKADIFDAVCQRFFLRVDSFIDRVSGHESGDYWQAFTAAIMRFYTDLNNDEFLQKFMSVVHLRCEYTDENKEIVDLLVQYRQLWQEQINQVILLGIKEQKIPNNIAMEEMNFFIRSSMLGLTATWLEDPDKVDLLKQASLNNRLLIQFLQNKDNPFAQS